jgi:hypothetical protein
MSGLEASVQLGRVCSGGDWVLAGKDARATSKLELERQEESWEVSEWTTRRVWSTR